MSSIQTYLQDILDAVYGEEVRGAIHNAIEECYTDVTTSATAADAAATAANAAADAANEAADEANTAASAAGAVSGEVAGLKRAVDDSAVDLVSLYGNISSRTHNGITFTPLRHGFSINGTANGAAFNNIFVEFPPTVKGDDILVLKINSSQYQSIGFGIFFYDQNHTQIGATQYVREDTEVHIPDNAVSWIFRLEVASGTVCDGDTAVVSIYKKMDSLYPYDEIYSTIHGMIRLRTPERQGISTAPPNQNFGVSYILAAQWYPPSFGTSLPPTLSVRWKQSQEMSVSGTTLVIS